MIEIPDLATISRAMRSGIVRISLAEWLDLDEESQELIADLGDRVAEVREARLQRIRTEGLRAVAMDRADGGSARRTRILATACGRAMQAAGRQAHGQK